MCPVPPLSNSRVRRNTLLGEMISLPSCETCPVQQKKDGEEQSTAKMLTQQTFAKRWALIIKKILIHAAQAPLLFSMHSTTGDELSSCCHHSQLSATLGKASSRIPQHSLLRSCRQHRLSQSQKIAMPAPQLYRDSQNKSWTQGMFQLNENL